MDTYEVLTNAQNLIRDPARWTKGQYAKDADGWVTDACHPDAHCWCSLGALDRCTPDEETYMRARQYLGLAVKFKGVTTFNDSGTHADVMAMFDRARELARAAA
jgi:hypothetical protein